MKPDHIVILVADLHVSLAFYAALLPMIGFSKSSDHVYGNADDIYIDIRPAEELDHPYRRYAPGLNHIGFTAPSLESVGQIRTSMANLGFEVPDIQSFGNDIALFMKDPDGMRIEIAAYAK